MTALVSMTGYPKLQGALGTMFGERVTRRALLEYEQRWSRAREGGTLLAAPRDGKPSLIIGTGAGGGRGVQPHRFSGE